MTPHFQTLRWTGLLIATVLIVLVPFALVGPALNDWTVYRLQGGSPAGSSAAVVIVALLAMDLVLPIPSSFVSTAAGGLVGFASGLAASVTGMTVCCLGGYGLGRTWGLTAVRRVVPEGELERAATLFRSHGIWALALMRPIPVLAEASVFWAGIIGIDSVRFLAVTFAANLAVSALYSALGAALISFP